MLFTGYSNQKPFLPFALDIREGVSLNFKIMAVYKFVEQPHSFEQIETTDAFKLHEAFKTDTLDNIIRHHKEKLYIFNELSNPTCFREGIYKIHGWIIDFRVFQKIFWVKYKNGIGIREISSFSKMFIRRNAANPGLIIKIVEVPNTKFRI